MPTTPRRRLSACLFLLVLSLLAVVPVTVTATSASARAAAALSVSPHHYIGGQRLTFEGNIGARGERRVKLQINLSRPGDEWKDVDDFRGATTQRDGDFSFGYTAPSMFGIRMRVASGRLNTPPITFQADSQDLVVEARSGESGLEPGQVLAGEPFRIEVDTTPNSDGERDLARRTDLPPPAYQGRVLTLQRAPVDQVGVPSYTDQWTTLGTTTTNAQGKGVFTGLGPERTRSTGSARRAGPRAAARSAGTPPSRRTSTSSAARAPAPTRATTAPVDGPHDRRHPPRDLQGRRVDDRGRDLPVASLAVGLRLDLRRVAHRRAEPGHGPGRPLGRLGRRHRPRRQAQRRRHARHPAAEHRRGQVRRQPRLHRDHDARQPDEVRPLGGADAHQVDREPRVRPARPHRAGARRPRRLPLRCADHHRRGLHPARLERAGRRQGAGRCEGVDPDGARRLEERQLHRVRASR